MNEVDLRSVVNAVVALYGIINLDTSHKIHRDTVNNCEQYHGSAVINIHSAIRVPRLPRGDG